MFKLKFSFCVKAQKVKRNKGLFFLSESNNLLLQTKAASVSGADLSPANLDWLAHTLTDWWHTHSDSGK